MFRQLRACHAAPDAPTFRARQLLQGMLVELIKLMNLCEGFVFRLVLHQSRVGPGTLPG